MATYIIADLKLFDNKQRDKLGFPSFAAMNNFIIKSWNKVVKPEDSVIVMGDVGSGKLEEMKEVISKLNGELTATSKHLNERFTKKEEEKPVVPTTKDCPYCKSTISIEAVKCPHCTSYL